MARRRVAWRAAANEKGRDFLRCALSPFATALSEWHAHITVCTVTVCVIVAKLPASSVTLQVRRMM